MSIKEAIEIALDDARCSNPDLSERELRRLFARALTCAPVLEPIRDAIEIFRERGVEI